MMRKLLVGHLRGGMGHVNVVSSVFFAGVNGSAVADTSALGSLLVPPMRKEGYSTAFAAGPHGLFPPPDFVDLKHGSG